MSPHLPFSKTLLSLCSLRLCGSFEIFLSHAKAQRNFFLKNSLNLIFLRVLRVFVVRLKIFYLTQRRRGAEERKQE
ncbi:hypothetical protein NIES2098_26200 [Calothrix sp. NIES-2098]|nr:hypothetical protein NIES2098_26200 [Calothrix sp. NIES-2098]